MTKTIRKQLSLFFSLFVFILLGCTATTTKHQDVDIYVGTRGLTAEFSKTAPPPRVFEDSNFPILLRIRNIGAYSIASDKQPSSDKQTLGVINIGREKDYIPKLSFEKNSRASEGEGDNEIFFSLDGKSQLNQNGDEIAVALNAKTGKLEPQSESKQSTITATLCYPYKTILSTTVCIDPDVSGISPEKKVCTVKELNFNSGQGAPIAVVKIEPQMIPEGDSIKPQFLIFVEDKGNGNSVDIKNYHNVCSDSDFKNAEDPNRKKEIKNIWKVAFLRAFRSGEEGKNQLICCPNIEGKCPTDLSDKDKITGFIRFTDKKGFVRCTFKDGLSKNYNAFTSPLKIEIEYGYVQTISTNFIIQKPLKY